jgi:hypothetical protein
LKTHQSTIYGKRFLTDDNILYHDGGNFKLTHFNPYSCRYARPDRVPEKAIMMDKSNAMIEIMTMLNEDGLMMPGCRAHEIVTEYMNFKIDRMGPEKALEDVRHTKEHLVAQIHQMAM